MSDKPTDEKKERDKNPLENLEISDLKSGFINFWERFLEDKLVDEGNLVHKFGFNVRELTAFETHEARKIFKNKLNYRKIRIFEGANLPNFLDDIGRAIKKMPKREIDIKNAITLGNNCFFGRTLKTDEIKDKNTQLDKNQLIEMSWLIHELTHAWQYQSMGWKYLLEAWEAQSKLGAKVYEFGGEDTLRKENERGKPLKEFNLEQQGRIVQTYYEKLKRNEDSSAFAPFIKQI